MPGSSGSRLYVRLAVARRPRDLDQRLVVVKVETWRGVGVRSFRPLLIASAALGTEQWPKSKIEPKIQPKRHSGRGATQPLSHVWLRRRRCCASAAGRPSYGRSQKSRGKRMNAGAACLDAACSARLAGHCAPGVGY